MVTAPLADLVALGLSVADGLVAIDGAKGLSAAVREGSATSLGAALHPAQPA